jgi:dTDP-4-dehydrorhamnose 3,5-epimerase
MFFVEMVTGKVIPTDLPGVLLIEPKIFGDSRGLFLELYKLKQCAELGICAPFVQDNISRSARGVVRGLHLQNPTPQGKLASVLRGKVLDVAVDVRVGSPTFGQHVAVELDGENFRQIWIPRGFAHGFRVLSETADFFYKCDNYYSAPDEITIRWNDPSLNIDWQGQNPILSERDANAPFLADVTNLPVYEHS